MNYYKIDPKKKFTEKTLLKLPVVSSLTTNLEAGYYVSDARLEYSYPYGKATLPREEWNVQKVFTPEEVKMLGDSIFKEFHIKYGKIIGGIRRYKERSKRYIIPQTYPVIEFKDFYEAVKYLIDNDGKICYCN
jgi:hypothetical protein